MSAIFSALVGAFWERELAMQTIYRKRERCTTVDLHSGHNLRLRRGIAWPGSLAVALCLCAQPAVAQGVPVGMVEQPCMTPPPDLAADADEREIAARRDAVAERRRADWAGLCRHRAANAALGEAPAQVVFIGDSITEFWEGAAPDLFQDGVINRGIGAQTSPQMLLRFQQDVVALRPRVVHIMAGTNDVAGNTGPSRPEDFKANIRSMVELAQAHGIRVVLGAIPPSAAFYWRSELRPAGRIAELNAWLRDYAAQVGAVFIDYHAAMRGPDGELRPELTEDGVHPNAQGYAVMSPLAREGIEAALAASPTPARP